MPEYYDHDYRYEILRNEIIMMIFDKSKDSLIVVKWQNII